MMEVKTIFVRTTLDFYDKCLGFPMGRRDQVWINLTDISIALWCHSVDPCFGGNQLFSVGKVPDFAGLHQH